MATCAANEPQPECVGASQEATELLKLLEKADLEEWHSKFLCYGYETVEDVGLMNEENMKEIGLDSVQRFCLKLNLPKKASSKCTKETRVTLPVGTLVIPSAAPKHPKRDNTRQTPFSRLFPSAAPGPSKRDNTQEVPRQTPVIPSAAPGPPKRDNTQEVPRQTPVIPSPAPGPPKRDNTQEVPRQTPVIPSPAPGPPKRDNTQEVPRQTPVIPSAAPGPPKRDNNQEVPKQSPVIPSAAPGPPKRDNTQEVPKQSPVIPSAALQPEMCSEKGCRRMAVSKCRECQALLCLTHQQTIRKEETSGNTTIVSEVPGCSKCKENHDQNTECEVLLKCLGGLVIPLLIGVIVLVVHSGNL